MGYVWRDSSPPDYRTISGYLFSRELPAVQPPVRDGPVRNQGQFGDLRALQHSSQGQSESRRGHR